MIAFHLFLEVLRVQALDCIDYMGGDIFKFEEWIDLGDQGHVNVLLHWVRVLELEDEQAVECVIVDHLHREVIHCDLDEEHI